MVDIGQGFLGIKVHKTKRGHIPFVLADITQRRKEQRKIDV